MTVGAWVPVTQYASHLMTYSMENQYPIHALKYSPCTDKKNPINMNIQFGLENFIAVDEINGYMTEDHFYTQSPALVFKDNNQIINPLRVDNAIICRNEDGEQIFDGSVNDFMSFDVGSGNMIPGNNSPFCSFSCFTLDNLKLYCSLGYYGQTGEVREFYNNFATKSIEQVDDDAFHIIATSFDNNVAVDGISGFNHFKAEINFKADNAIPVLTGLQCRDSEGIVSQSFNASMDGRIYLTDGCFTMTNHVGGMAIWNSEFSMPDVKLEYAPHGSEDFLEIESIEMKEISDVAGIGAFFICNLDEVNRHSDTGWFDVRVTVKTSDGNYQTQTLAPCFYVDALCGIKGISSESQNGMKYYNLQGIELSNPQKGLNIVQDTEGNIRKVMIP